MKLCPVDLSACHRPGCGGGHCEMAESPRLVLCWDCGAVEHHGVVGRLCVACMAVYTNNKEPEAT